jgi:hypothetical protein
MKPKAFTAEVYLKEKGFFYETEMLHFWLTLLLQMR